MWPLHSWGSRTPSAGGGGRSYDLLPSRGPRRGRRCYVTTAFSVVPNDKRGDEIRSGCLTPAFSGARKMPELLCNPCILGNPRQGGMKWEVAAPLVPS